MPLTNEQCAEALKAGSLVRCSLTPDQEAAIPKALPHYATRQGGTVTFMSPLVYWIVLIAGILLVLGSVGGVMWSIILLSLWSLIWEGALLVLGVLLILLALQNPVRAGPVRV